MNRASQQMRVRAERLIYFDEIDDNTTDPLMPEMRECDKLRAPLTTLMGSAGFNALLSRAHDLAKAEVAWLRKVKVNPDGTFEGLNEIYPQLKPQQWAEGKVVLLAQLLGLLVAFIGESLTLKLVSQVWPRLSNRVNYEERKKNEKE